MNVYDGRKYDQAQGSSCVLCSIYNPKKLIKHSIEIYVCCCAISGHPLSWEVYCGKDTIDMNDSIFKNSSKLVYLCNCKCVGPQEKTGGIPITDISYTSSVELLKYLCFRLKWLFIESITTTEKKTSRDYDIPFLKLSKAALEKL